MRQHGFYFGKHALARMYKRNKVKFLQAKKKRRVALVAENRFE